MNLTKKVKDLYSKMCKSRNKEINEHMRRWKGIPFSWIGRIDIMKMDLLTNAIYKLNTIPSKLQ
jgi:hypothetical protein